MEIDTLNKFLVGSQGGKIVIMALSPRKLTKEESLNLAAWLVAMVDIDNEFNSYLEAIKNS